MQQDEKMERNIYQQKLQQIKEDSVQKLNRDTKTSESENLGKFLYQNVNRKIKQKNWCRWEKKNCCNVVEIETICCIEH